MWSYVIGITAIFLYFFDPLGSRNSGTKPSRAATIPRLPRPKLNEELLAIGLNSTNDSLLPLECSENDDAYSIHVFTREPLVIYVENFLGRDERRTLLELSEPLFAPSTTTSDGGSSFQADKSIRNSEVAVLPRDDVTVRCIERRARAFQGWRDEVWTENLRTQRYVPGGHYGGHFDWSGNTGGWGRVSSFMVWVSGEGREEVDGEGKYRDEVKVKGGGTQFPLLRMGDVEGDWGQHWCRFVECRHGYKKEKEEEGSDVGDKEKKGVVFIPRPGNAVFWENFRSDGSARGYEEAWHLGLPVEKGVKVGLNIWSWGRID